MNIKKRYKKEKSIIRRNSLIVALMMFLIPYMVVILNDEGVFKGLEYKFALIYASIIDLLLIIYVIKKINDSSLSFQMVGRKMKIRLGLFRFSFSVPVDKALYVDILESKNQNYELVIITKKGKKNKNFVSFNIGFVKTHQQYKSIYEHMTKLGGVVDYNCMIITLGGSKKFNLLYALYKNSYNAEFSPKAVDYVKKFMEEYNMT